MLLYYDFGFFFFCLLYEIIWVNLFCKLFFKKIKYRTKRGYLCGCERAALWMCYQVCWHLGYFCFLRRSLGKKKKKVITWRLLNKPIQGIPYTSKVNWLSSYIRIIFFVLLTIPSKLHSLRVQEFPWEQSTSAVSYTLKHGRWNLRYLHAPEVCPLSNVTISN